MLTVDDISMEVLLLWWFLWLPEGRTPSPFSSLDDDDDDDDDDNGLLTFPNSIDLVCLDDCMCFRTSVACSNALHRRK